MATVLRIQLNSKRGKISPSITEVEGLIMRSDLALCLVADVLLILLFVLPR